MILTGDEVIWREGEGVRCSRMLRLLDEEVDVVSPSSIAGSSMTVGGREYEAESLAFEFEVREDISAALDDRM